MKALFLSFSFSLQTESDDPLILAIQRFSSSTWYNHVLKVGLETRFEGYFNCARFFFSKKTGVYRIIQFLSIFTNFREMNLTVTKIIITKYEILSDWQQTDRLLQSSPQIFSIKTIQFSIFSCRTQKKNNSKKISPISNLRAQFNIRNTKQPKSERH